VHIERNINKVLSDGLANNISLLVGGILQQFLAEVVTKRICETLQENFVGAEFILLTSHKICKVTEGLTENHITVFWNPFLQLLLQVPATMLVFAEARYLSR
jgi:hypothetical protein